MTTPASNLEYFRRASFIKSVEQLRDLPPDDGAEVAFVGRSNVGKSSVLNALCDHRGLARTSRTPGRTQHFVVFELVPGCRLMDLPGFGYAAVNKSMRTHWERTIPRYLETRASLAGMVLIADARHPLKAEELTLVDWCVAARVPLALLLNKADKLGRQAAQAAVRAGQREMTTRGASAAAAMPFSALEKEGVPALRALVDGWLMGQAKKGPGDS